MKRNKKVQKPVPEDSTDGSDTEEVPSPLSTKKGNTVTRKTKNVKPAESSDTKEIPSPQAVKKRNTRKTRNSKPGESSDTEDIPSPPAMKKGNIVTRKPRNEKPGVSSGPEAMRKLPVKNVKEIQKKIVESSDSTQVAGSSRNSDSGEIPSILLKRKVRVKKANVPVPEQNSDTTVNSVVPENLSQIVKKKMTKRASSTTEPSENSAETDLKQKQQMLLKKRKRLLKAETNSNDSDEEENPQNIMDEENEDFIKEEISSDESEKEDEATNHVRDLEQLKSVDPEFYNFLQEHDSKLLNFNDRNYLGETLNNDDDDRKPIGRYEMPRDLRGASDESDFEPDENAPEQSNVTLKMVHDVQFELQKTKITLDSIGKAVKIFKAAVERMTSEDGTTKGEFKVAGLSVYKAVINMAVVYLPNGMARYLGFITSGKPLQKCKHFVKIKTTLIEYLLAVLRLIYAVTSDCVLTILLKHLHQLSVFVACFTRISKTAIKTLLPKWSDGEETVRVLAFLCILRITRNQQNILLVPVLRAMFVTYINNCRFVSPSTWGGINFMRRSLVEMFTLDLSCSYVHVFLYVRQLGIHLRNAIVVPKLEHKQSVFNWQYMNALHLWAELVSQNTHNSGMRSLFFPLVMIISNTIKLGPTPQYYPMRFYLIEMLMKMETMSGQFVTIMPFFMDVITQFDINQKHKRVSMKPLDFSSIIRLSKSQMYENGFKDAVIERLYALLLEYTTSIAHKMVFPDCCVVLILFFRELVDKCNNSNHKKKLKQLLDKIIENNDYMNEKRVTFDGHLSDLSSIVAWEKQIKAQGTPLMTYYENWKKLNKIQKRKEVTENDELAEVLPLIKRRKVADVGKKEPESKVSGPVELFPSDSEDDNFFKGDDDEEIPEENVKKSIKGKKEKNTINKEITKKQNKRMQKGVSEASNSDELGLADTGDVVSEFTW